MNKKTVTLLITLIGFIFSAKVAFALPSKPGLPSAPSQGGVNTPRNSGPALPPQPELPPCLECDEFLGRKTPTPSAISTPEPTSNPSGGQSQTDSSSSDDDDDDSGVGGPEVLGLSDTAGIDGATIISILGFLCAAFGIRMRGK